MGIPTTPPSYIRVRAGMRPQTERHTDTHRRGWPQYMSRRLRLTRNVINNHQLLLIIYANEQVLHFALLCSTGMGDRLRAGKQPQYFTKPPRPTQPPTRSGTRNKYRPKCSDALSLRSKAGMAHLICGLTCGWNLGSNWPTLSKKQCVLTRLAL